jgi:hypothetical protein
VEVKKVSLKVFEEAKAKKPKRGRYSAIIDEVISSGEPVELSNLSRGAVSAVSRVCKDKAVECVPDYKNGKAYIAPKVK